jgi:ketosteroid isomerase-like protein
VSQANVEVMRRAIEAWNRQDVPGTLQYVDPEIRFEHRLADLQGRFEGVDGVRTFFEDIGDYFDTWEVDCRDIRDLGDRVLALGILRAVGKDSGVETELPFTALATFSKGRITDFIDFGDKDQALKVVGLEE